MMVLVQIERFYKSNWVECHHNHCFMIRNSKPNSLLPGDSIITGLSRYPNVWNEYLALINVLNLEIGGDHIKNVLCQVIDLNLPSSVKNIVILYRTNNVTIYSPCDIADCIISKGSVFWKKSYSINASVCGLIPLEEC